VQYVSPKRAGADVPATSLPQIAPAEPISTYVAAPGDTDTEADDEPSVPDEARARIIADATAAGPLDAGPDTTLHVRFASSAPSDRVIGAMESFKSVLRDHPGSTRVVIHLPSPSGPLPMALRRGVAYDADLVAEVRRRFGDGMVELDLA
jgi:hypothetical protein